MVGNVTRQNAIGVQEVIKKLTDIKNLKTQVGWFPGAKYQDGTPVAYVVAIQEYGTTFTHPGGTKYVIGKDGKAVFVKDSYSGKIAGVTKPHQVTIPPRPFMRTTVSEQKTEWAKLVKSGSKAMLTGDVSANTVMEGLGLAVAGDVKKKITQISSPPLKASTVRSKRQKLAKGKRVGNLTKPLVETGLMLSSLSHSVESS